MNEIFTLEARDNVMLEFIQEYSNLSSIEMFHEINLLHKELKDILIRKKINYNDLKTCLIPSIKKKESLFIFDSQKINNSWYGNEVFEQILPLFDRKTNHSILSGDLLGRNYNQDDLSLLLEKSLNKTEKLNYVHSSQFYLVYINNMTEKNIDKFNKSLEEFNGYVGYVDLTYSSFFKTLISTMLCNVFIKYKTLIIQGHEDDRSNNEDHNLKGYNFEKYGFKVKSLQMQYYDLFLSYKIEREVIKGFEKDLEFSLNAISPKFVDISQSSVVIDDEKLGYFIKEKSSQFKKANLEISKEKLIPLIENKLLSNYIYNMRINEYDDLIFNIIIEVENDKTEKVKMLLSLKYLSQDNQLKLITMF